MGLQFFGLLGREGFWDSIYEDSGMSIISLTQNFEASSPLIFQLSGPHKGHRIIYIGKVGYNTHTNPIDKSLNLLSVPDNHNLKLFVFIEKMSIVTYQNIL